MTRHYSVNEIIRRALIAADQDISSWIESMETDTSPESRALVAEETEFLKALRAYRRRRFPPSNYDTLQELDQQESSMREVVNDGPRVFDNPFPI